jgi:hypothetical protein
LLTANAPAEPWPLTGRRWYGDDRAQAEGMQMAAAALSRHGGVEQP